MNIQLYKEHQKALKTYGSRTKGVLCPAGGNMREDAKDVSNAVSSSNSQCEDKKKEPLSRL